MAPRERDVHIIDGQPHVFEDGETLGSARVAGEMRNLLKKGVIGYQGPLPAYRSAQQAAQSAPINLISVSGNDDEAAVVTVTLHGPAMNKRANFNNRGMSAIALLTWGCGGTIAQAEIDWVGGAMFSVSASRLTLGGYVDIIGPDLGPTIQSADVRTFGAFVSFGQCTRTVPLTRTVQGGSLVAGGTNTYIVPPFARMFRFMSNSSPLGDPQIGGHVLWLDYNAGPIATDRWPVGGGPIPPLMVPAGACAMEFNNDGSENADITYAVFELGL